MKKITRFITASILIFTASGITAQRNCATMENHTRLEETRENYKTDRLQYEQAMQQFLSSTSSAKTTTAVITIPVVVHVVYKTAVQNISDLQVLSQIAAVNEDFGRTNADTVNTPTVWNSVSANTNIQFCLAQRDPNGNPTTGIERRLTTLNSFGTDDKVKAYSTGGLDAWDPTRYMNIWVCNMTGGLLGYGEFPTNTVSNTYGVVIKYNAFGRVGTVAAPFNLGRTLTHEFSHCFNLYHIWGDDNGACWGNDQCADTPNQANSTNGCFTFPKVDACTTTTPGIMFMNYMDYSNDNCLNMFTQNQSTRMNAVLNVAPYNALLSSNGCVPVPLPANDAGVIAISEPNGSYCSSSVMPQITLKNFGSSTLTTAVINYRIDNNPVQTYTYTGSIGSLTSAPVMLPTLPIATGNHTFTAYASLPNALMDMNNVNDTTKVLFDVVTMGQPLPFSEGFETTAFAPAGWGLNNPDGTVTWKRTTSAKKSGVASAVINNYSGQFKGELDELISPVLDLTTVPGPMLTFEVAYRLYTNPASNPNHSDTLEVLISTDCGATYTSLYKQYGANLATTTPSWAANSFTPNAMQWRMEMLMLNDYAFSQNALIKFRNTSDNENNLYLDDINISGTTGIERANLENGFSIYPNPTTGNVVIDLKSRDNILVQVVVLNSLGQPIYRGSQSSANETLQVDLSAQTNGIYLIQLMKGDKTYYSKITVNK